eukprot:Filipodium_phascolosomae@DN6946_c0_g1_i1.p1
MWDVVSFILAKSFYIFCPGAEIPKQTGGGTTKIKGLASKKSPTKEHKEHLGRSSCWKKAAAVGLGGENKKEFESRRGICGNTGLRLQSWMKRLLGSKKPSAYAAGSEEEIALNGYNGYNRNNRNNGNNGYGRHHSVKHGRKKNTINIFLDGYEWSPPPPPQPPLIP